MAEKYKIQSGKFKGLLVSHPGSKPMITEYLDTLKRYKNLNEIGAKDMAYIEFVLRSSENGFDPNEKMPE